MHYPEPISKLIEGFMKLPGIGPKTAGRLAFYVLKMKEDDVLDLAKALVNAKRNLTYCTVCSNITIMIHVVFVRTSPEINRRFVLCRIQRILLPWKEPKNTRDFIMCCMEHIPMDGIGPEDIKITELLKRLEDERVQELILATNPTIEGEATSMYISRLVKPFGLKVTRIAHGLPVGGDLEYADEVTLTKALEGRREL